MIQRKNKILVLSSTYPRWKNDTDPRFVHDLCVGLNSKNIVEVISPSYKKSKDTELINGININRFRYFFNQFETLSGNGGIIPNIKKNFLNIFLVPFFILGEIIKTIKIVKKIHPNIVHAHWIIPQGITAYIIKKIFNIPYILTSHGSDINSIKFNFIKKLILGEAKYITVVSNDLKKQIIKINSNLKNKIIVAPMGVDSKIFNTKNRKININKKEKIVLFVGRLIKSKGIFELIEAMDKIINNNKNIKLLIIGDGTLKDEIENIINTKKLSKNIKLIGKIDHKKLAKYYSEADLCVLPSYKEGFGLSLVEAAMCGCKIASSNIGGLKDIVDKKYTFNVKNEKNIIKIILSALNNEYKIDSIYYSKNYSWESVIEKYNNLLKNDK